MDKSFRTGSGPTESFLNRTRVD